MHKILTGYGQKVRGGVGDHPGAYSVAAVDASGNIYVAGSFVSSTITFGSITLTKKGLENLFFAKFDASGEVLWAKSAGGKAIDIATSIVLDVSGNIYVTGDFSSPSITFDSTTLIHTTNYGQDVFLTKYNANGNVLWAKSTGGTKAKVLVNSAAVDVSGNIYLAGSFTSPTITFGSIILTKDSDSYNNFYLAKYDSNGNALWAKSTGGFNDAATSVALDASGNIYLAGWFSRSTITFGDYTLKNTHNATDDIFLVKYNADGNVLWAKSAGGKLSDKVSSIAVDALGNIFVAGSFISSTITFDSIILTKSYTFGKGDFNTNSNFYLAKYNANGNVLWAKSTGGMDDGATSVASDASGNIYLAGYFRDWTITFGSYTLKNTLSGANDIFLVKYNTDGNVLWAKGAGGKHYDDIYSIALDASGNIYITGKFDSPTIAFGSTILNNIHGPMNSRSWNIFLAKSKF